MLTVSFCVLCENQEAIDSYLANKHHTLILDHLTTLLAQRTTLGKHELMYEYYNRRIPNCEIRSANRKLTTS